MNGLSSLLSRLFLFSLEIVVRYLCWFRVNLSKIIPIRAVFMLSHKLYTATVYKTYLHRPLLTYMQRYLINPAHVKMYRSQNMNTQCAQKHFCIQGITKILHLKYQVIYRVYGNFFLHCVRRIQFPLSNLVYNLLSWLHYEFFIKGNTQAASVDSCTITKYYQK